MKLAWSRGTDHHQVQVHGHHDETERRRRDAEQLDGGNNIVDKGRGQRLEVSRENSRGKEAGEDDGADGQRRDVAVDRRLWISTHLTHRDQHQPVTEDHADHRNHVDDLEQHCVGKAAAKLTQKTLFDG